MPRGEQRGLPRLVCRLGLLDFVEGLLHDGDDHVEDDEYVNAHERQEEIRTHYRLARLVGLVVELASHDDEHLQPQPW